MKSRRTVIPNAEGFGLVEVLVSLIIIAVGLLGVAKIQAIAFSETSTASVRSLAAIEASSMAASIHANRAYWSTGGGVSPGNLTIDVAATTGSAVTSTDAAMVGTPNCAVPGTPCSTRNMALYDVQQWNTALLNVLGAGSNYDARIDCPTVVQPITCTIRIRWTERMATTATGAQAAANSAVIYPTYALYVQP